MANHVRIGAVSYLNTRPLVFGLEQGLAADRIRLSYDVPSALADRMARGELDIALLPSIELARIPDLEVVPGLAIATRGPACSVVLVTQRPPREARTVALDPDSRTSNALCRILFRDVWRTRPEFGTGERDLGATLSRFDAALRIGDKALFEPVPAGSKVHDLGEAWTVGTGRPFVFAVWAARTGVLDREIYRALHGSYRRGRQVLDQIAEDYSWNGRRYPALSQDYLRGHMRYRLGSPEVDALRVFLAAAAEMKLAPAVEVRLAFTRWTACHEAAAAERRAVRAGETGGR